MRDVLSTLKIGFDLDTILAATDEASISWYQERGLVGPEVTAAQITRWNHAECLGVEPADMVAMFTSEAFYSGIPPIYDATRLARGLHHNGAEIHVFTDRPCPAVTAEWLERYDVPYHRLEFMKAEEKPFYTERMGLDFTLEDHPKTAHWLAQKVRGISFLRDRPYNRDSSLHPKLHRFYTFEEIYRFFRL